MQQQRLQEARHPESLPAHCLFSHVKPQPLEEGTHHLDIHCQAFVNGELRILPAARLVYEYM